MSALRRLPYVDVESHSVSRRKQLVSRIYYQFHFDCHRRHGHILVLCRVSFAARTYYQCHAIGVTVPCRLSLVSSTTFQHHITGVTDTLQSRDICVTDTLPDQSLDMTLTVFAKSVTLDLEIVNDVMDAVNVTSVSLVSRTH